MLSYCFCTYIDGHGRMIAMASKIIIRKYVKSVLCRGSMNLNKTLTTIPITIRCLLIHFYRLLSTFFTFTNLFMAVFSDSISFYRYFYLFYTIYVSYITTEY